MTLTRLAFFKLVGAMGIGQAVTLKPNEICCPDNMGQSGHTDDYRCRYVTHDKNGRRIESPAPCQLAGLVKGVEWPEGIQTGPLSDRDTQCLKPSSDRKRWEFTKCNADCEPGEERCPMGHCQKPRTYYVKTYPYCSDLGDVGGIPEGLGQHVCSVCGIVYVPSEGQAKT